jgi:uncharacterized Ntn-hydrolase superfamily protein
MTWSILARDSDGRYGVAIASRFCAVGALTVHTRRGAGALATQALLNPLYGPAGLALLGRRSHRRREVVSTLTAADAGRAQRQLHVIAAHGPGAAHTGDGCVDWCGHRVGDGYSVAGNMLAGPQVLQATADAYVANARPAARRATHRRAGRRRGGRRRQARQAGGGAAHPGRRGLCRGSTSASTTMPSRSPSCGGCHELSLERFQPFIALPRRAPRSGG